MVINVGSGIGTGPTQLSAFDAALNHAGVANYNLIYLSSVVPPNSKIVSYKNRPIPAKSLSGKWGDRLYVVIAERRTSVPNEEVWAGIGWVQDKKTGKGLFVEHTGENKASVKRDIHHSLEALMATRNINFGPIRMQIAGKTCGINPVSVLVVAVYQSDGWKNYNE